MTETQPERRSEQEQSRCQTDYFPGRPSCAEPAQTDVDGLLLCEEHALEAKLEGQIACWEGILAHIDLWSREATRRDRPDIVILLDLERIKATSAIVRACSDLNVAGSQTSRKEALGKRCVT